MIRIYARRIGFFLLFLFIEGLLRTICLLALCAGLAYGTCLVIGDKLASLWHMACQREEEGRR